MGLEDVVARVRSGVFHIVALDDKNERIASGTGFLSGGYFGWFVEGLGRRPRKMH